MYGKCFLHFLRILYVHFSLASNQIRDLKFCLKCVLDLCARYWVNMAKETAL